MQTAVNGGIRNNLRLDSHTSAQVKGSICFTLISYAPLCSCTYPVYLSVGQRLYRPSPPRPANAAKTETFGTNHDIFFDDTAATEVYTG